MRQVYALCLCSALIALIGCSGVSTVPSATAPQSAASNPSVTPTAAQAVDHAPDLLVWNGNSDGSDVGLYAYWIDANGQLTPLPGFPLPQASFTQAFLDRGQKLLFVSQMNGYPSGLPNAIKVYGLDSSGPQLLSVTPAPNQYGGFGFVLWPQTHELWMNSANGVGDFPTYYLAPYSYDASGTVTANGSPMNIGSEVFAQTIVPSSQIFGLARVGHGCSSSVYDLWSVGDNGALTQVAAGNAILPDPSMQTDCGSGILGPARFTASGKIFLAPNVSQSFNAANYDLYSVGLSADGNLQPIAIAQTGNNIVDSIAIDEANQLAFAVVHTSDAQQKYSLLWYSFNPNSGAISAQPVGQRADLAPKSVDEAGGYVVLGEAGSVNVYSVSTAGLTQVSSQPLPLAATFVQTAK